MKFVVIGEPSEAFDHLWMKVIDTPLVHGAAISAKADFSSCHDR